MNTQISRRKNQKQYHQLPHMLQKQGISVPHYKYQHQGSPQNIKLLLTSHPVKPPGCKIPQHTNSHQNKKQNQKGLCRPQVMRLESYEKCADTGRVRKYYHLTEKGRHLLREKQKEWEIYERSVRDVMKGGLTAIIFLSIV